ncbi:MAG: hypothetical protein OXT49_11180, partial [Gammaproteobacteria bacterium]|nr:hypothetical protein [Gammaproteobacteria bacterium]
IVFLLGDDAYEHIASWKEYTELPALCHMVVVSRPGYQQAIDGVAAEWLDRYKPTPDLSIETSLAGSVQHLLVTAVDVSATQIRRILGAGKLPEGLLPEAVLRFLEPKLCHPTPAQN